jgi:hypothetical protein
MCHLHIAIKDLFGIGNVERVRSILELFGFCISKIGPTNTNTQQALHIGKNKYYITLRQ